MMACALYDCTIMGHVEGVICKNSLSS